MIQQENKYPPFLNDRTEEEIKEQLKQIRRFLKKEKLKVKLDDTYFERLKERKELDHKKRAANIALMSKIPSVLTKKVTEFIASGKKKTKKARKSRIRGRRRRGSRCGGKRGTRRWSKRGTRRWSKRGTRRGSRRGKR